MMQFFSRNKDMKALRGLGVQRLLRCAASPCAHSFDCWWHQLTVSLLNAPGYISKQPPKPQADSAAVPTQLQTSPLLAAHLLLLGLDQRPVNALLAQLPDRVGLAL